MVMYLAPLSGSLQISVIVVDNRQNWDTLIAICFPCSRHHRSLKHTVLQLNFQGEKMICSLMLKLHVHHWVLAFLQRLVYTS